MHFVYLLLLNDIPIYAGMTKNPVTRYKNHFRSCGSCYTSQVLRYYLFKRNNIVTMSLIYCSIDRKKAFKMEGIAINALITQGFNILNYRLGKDTFPHLDKSEFIGIAMFDKINTDYINEDKRRIIKSIAKS